MTFRLNFLAAGSGLVAIALASCGGGTNTYAPSGAGADIASAKSTHVAAPVVSPAFYVSPTGSDSNNGLSASEPFLTLEKAQTAMEGSSTKTTYLLGGTYARSTTLTLGTNDEGESWLGYPGEVPELNGKESTAVGISVGGANITVRWLTIDSYTQSGIEVQNTTGSLIDSNIVQDLSSDGFNEGGIVLIENVSGMTITHNSIYNVGWAGIAVSNGPTDSISNILIAYNKINTTCTKLNDCGAIYAENRNHNTTDAVIQNNVISNYGTTSMTSASKGIYLDDELSFVTVEDNIVYGTGTYGFQIHGGDHNTFKNNIFDISNSIALGLYQYDGSYHNYGMAQNDFTCNIIYSSASSVPSSLWESSTILTGQDPPEVTSNVYWGTIQKLATVNPYADTAPIYGTEDFVNPASGNYNFTSGPPTGCGFTAINTSTVGPLPNN